MTPYVVGVCIALLGACWITVMANNTTAVQSILPNFMRARGMAVHQMVFFGAMVAGSLLWGKIAEQAWLGVLVPEEYGGLGLGVTELGIILEEMGRALVPGPYFACAALAAPALAWSASLELKRRWLEPLATGAAQGYAMQYRTCNNDLFEVRWNVMEVSPNPSSRISLLTVSSRQVSAANGRATLFAPPTTLRTLIEN